MNLQSIKNKVLPRTILEAIVLIHDIELRDLDTQDQSVFANASNKAKIGDYEVSLVGGPTFDVLFVVDTDRITFITCDEDGIDVMKEFIVKAV
jgi:hypothetical protein